MPTVELTDQQVVELVRQLSPSRKREALLALADGTTAVREQRMHEAESQLRRLAAQRGANWDAMSENDRESFIDGLVHEDRPCGT